MDQSYFTLTNTDNSETATRHWIILLFDHKLKISYFYKKTRITIPLEATYITITKKQLFSNTYINAAKVAFCSFLILIALFQKNARNASRGSSILISFENRIPQRETKTIYFVALFTCIKNSKVSFNCEAAASPALLKKVEGTKLLCEIILNKPRRLWKHGVEQKACIKWNYLKNGLL